MPSQCLDNGHSDNDGHRGLRLLYKDIQLVSMNRGIKLGRGSSLPPETLYLAEKNHFGLEYPPSSAGDGRPSDSRWTRGS